MPAGEGEDGFGPRQGSDFQNLHRNKRSLTLNLKDPRGVEVLKRLVRTADVLVENYRPDVKHKLGIDYETLAEENPRLIYASISGFGQDGPYRDRAGFDQVAQGMGGLMWVTGLPGQGPVRAGIPVADLSAGLFAALGVLIALQERSHLRQRPVGAELAAVGDGDDDGFPGRALAGGRRGPGAGRQRSSDLDADQRLSDRRRLRQHRGGRQGDLRAPVRSARRAGAGDASRLRDRGAALEESRRAESRRSPSARDATLRRR